MEIPCAGSETPVLTLCLVYGCFVGRLQTAFRQIYNIEGNGFKDYLSGCCCPAASVTRMEMEATVRSEERRLLKELPSILEESDSNLSLVETYKSQTPMVCPKPVVSQIRTENSSPTVPVGKVPALRQTTASRSHRNSDADASTLATIPEAVPSPVTPVLSVQQPSGIEVERPRDAPVIIQVPDNQAKRHSLQHDPVVPVNASTKPWPLLKYLGQKWYMAPPTKKENEEPTPAGGKSNDSVASGRSEERAKVAARFPPAKVVTIKDSPRHSLDRDQRYATTAIQKHAAHGLEEDVMEPIDFNSGRFKEHLLEHDPASLKKGPATDTPHHLDSDTTHQTQPQTQLTYMGHDLAEDELAKAAGPTASHELVTDTAKDGKAEA